MERLLALSETAPPSFRRLITHPQLRVLYDHWLAHSAEGGVMPRDAFDPSDMPGLLSNLLLADVGDGGHDICYRVVGTEIVAAHGFDFTGWAVERLTSGSTLDFTRRLYGQVVAGAVPVFSEGHFRWEDKSFHWTTRLHLPLSRRGDGQVDMVLVGQFFEAGQGRAEQLRPAEPAELSADRASLAHRK